MILERGGRRHVAVNAVVERGYVGRPLDRGVAPERHDPAAGPAHVAEQELEQGAAADHLRAVGVLGPPDGVGPPGGPVPPRVLQHRLGHLEERLLGATGYLLHHLGRVPAEVALHYLEHATRVPEGLVALGRRFPERADHRLERLARTRLTLSLFPAGS